jgi:octaprenyl-diphosphate synthase
MTIAEELDLVEDRLREAVASNVDLLAGASQYIIHSGGKRLRPRIVLLSYKSLGGEETSSIVPVAAAVELVHTASLIHDDINDHSDTRRGRATINARWGSSLALLIGDFVFVRLLNLIADLDPRVIRVMAQCCTGIVEGETLQMLHLGDTELTEETYLRIVELKTALLFSACAELGAAVGGGTEEEIAALREYGLNLGFAFQIRDDTLDLIGQTGELGKPVASDLGQGKMGLATIYALGKSRGARKILFSNDAQRVNQLLAVTGALDYAAAKAQECVEKAKRALSLLPGSQAKSELIHLADFAVLRGK